MTTRSTGMYEVTKRALDVGGATVLLLGLSPLMGVVALWIWWKNGRPVFFTQIRAGRRGHPFRILKFRTLSTGPKDPTRPAAHTTRIGAVLRRWALDELPQLWNVVRGEMSLVGPRPVPLNQVDEYGTYQRLRLQIRPGLTGWAQIHGRNAIPWPVRIEHDVWYVHNRSLLLDLRILAQTPFILIQGAGVNGPGGDNPRFSPSNGSSRPSS